MTEPGPAQDMGSPRAEPAARLDQSLPAWPQGHWLCSTARLGLSGIVFLIQAVLQQNRGFAYSSDPRCSLEKLSGGGVLCNAPETSCRAESTRLTWMPPWG